MHVRVLLSSYLPVDHITTLNFYDVFLKTKLLGSGLTLMNHASMSTPTSLMCHYLPENSIGSREFQQIIYTQLYTNYSEKILRS